MGKGKDKFAEAEYDDRRSVVDTQLRVQDLERRVCALTDALACVSENAILQTDLVSEVWDPCLCLPSLVVVGDCGCLRNQVDGRIEELVEWDTGNGWW